MKVKAVKKLHPATFEKRHLSSNRWILANLMYIDFELPDDFKSALLEINPNLFADAKVLHDKFTTMEPDKTYMLTDSEIYILYIAHDLLGRLLASSWREEVLNAFMEEGKERLPPDQIEKLYRYALGTTGPTLKETEKYARREKCLKQLPEIKRKLRQLPDLD